MIIDALIALRRVRYILSLSAGLVLASVLLASPRPAGAQVVRAVPVNAHDLVYDSSNETVYASVIADGTLVPINVASGTAGTGVFTGDSPGKIVITDNNQYVYVTHGTLGAISRFNIQTGAFDFSWSLGQDNGPNYAEDVAVVPTQPHALLVVLYNAGVSPHFAGMKIYDDGISRTNTASGFDSVAYSDSPSVFYAYENSLSSLDFDQFNVNAAGMTYGDNLTGLIGGGYTTIKYGGGFVFASNGYIIDPVKKQGVGTFSGSPFLPDGPDNSLWTITTGNPGLVFNQYSLSTFQITRSVNVTGVPSSAGTMVKTGADSFAITAGGEVYLVDLSGTQVASVSVTPTSLCGGQGAIGTVTLGNAAAAGTVVNLTSSSPLVGLPASVTIPQGATQQTFRITTKSVSATTAVTITARAGGSSATAALTLVPYALTGLTAARIAYEGGHTNVGAVTLSGAAPPGGQVVSLASSNPAAAGVPTSVLVPAGTTYARFHITAPPTASSVVVTITAAMQGVHKQVALTIGPPKIAALVLAPSDLFVGHAAQATVLLTVPAPPGGLTVMLSSNSPSAAVPSSVTVPAGFMSKEFRVVASGGVSTTATITATTADSSAKAGLSIAL